MKYILFVFGLSVICTCALLGLFHIGIWISLAFFYRGLVYIVLTSIVLLLILLGTRNRFGIPLPVVFAVVCIFVSVHMMFFTLVPVTLDRSISTFLLETMSENTGHSFSKNELEKVLISEYIEKHQALEKRFAEQMQTGTIKRKGEGYVITDKGIRLVSLYRFIGRLFGISVSP